MHLYCPEIHLTSISICLEADSLQANLICVKNAYNHAGYTSSKQIKKPILRIEVPFWELKSHNHYSLLKYYLNLSVTVSCLPSNIVLPFTKFNELNKNFTAQSWITNSESIPEDRKLWCILMPKPKVVAQKHLKLRTHHCCLKPQTTLQTPILVIE